MFKKKINGHIDNNTSSPGNLLRSSTEAEILDILKKGSGVIYLGFPECPWCAKAVPVLEYAAETAGLREILYLNISDIRDKLTLDENKKVITEKEGSAGYYEMLKILDPILDEYLLKTNTGEIINTGEKRILAPTVLFVKNGELVAYHIGTVDSHKNAYERLNEEQIEELNKIYSDNITKILQK